MAKKREFKVPSKRQPIFSVVRKILKMTLWRGISVTVLPDKIEERSILVGVHAAKKAPMAYELMLPVFNVKWGAHEMLGNYKSRRAYLKDVFYMQKQGMKKGRATIKASFEAIFSKMLYKGMKLIGTYQDGRMRTSLKDSVKVLEDNKAIVIFPEDSSTGYFDVLTSFFPGFVMLSESYYKKHGVDLPIYPIYYNHKIRKMVVGYPYYVQDLRKKGMDRYEIAQFFCNEVNKLYYEFFEEQLKLYNAKKAKK